MEELFQEINARLAAGESLALVTVVLSKGSTPRAAGAKMLVGENGRICGTVGGGALENEGERLAVLSLCDKTSKTYSFSLSPDDAAGIGMACGGGVTLFIRYIPAGDSDFLALSGQALQKIRTSEPCFLVTDLNAGIMAIESERAVVPGDALSGGYFIEELVPPGAVYIFGGGHVAQALVPVLAGVGFRCVVLDDRAEFLKPELFSGAWRVLPVDFTDIGKTVEVTENDYIVIMTRGHVHDFAVEAQALKTKSRYIGVIGSRGKKAFVEEKLRALGFSDTEISRVYTPVGLAIGAETPAEIAVSIAAQLILIRSGV